MLVPPARSARRSGNDYKPPSHVETIWLRDLVQSTKRGGQPKDINLFYAGDLGLASLRCVSVVGTREPTPEGLSRATRLARELVEGGAVVVSGLARGIDSAAHRSAIENRDRVLSLGTRRSIAPAAQTCPVNHHWNL